ncbi:MAG: 50S ribosomal protein L17 [Candidatus Liptonbacteria bacterium]|nr:50S ribosomal protein L17 [Candidatus Liptonbacteria bacterium]
MRHRKTGRKFHRLAGPRRAFIRNLASELIRREKIETTETRAKAIRPIVERLVSIAKKQTLASHRLLLSRIHNRQVVKKLYDELGPRYTKRPGGYLRISKLSKSRNRDGSRLARVEFV